MRPNYESDILLVYIKICRNSGIANTSLSDEKIYYQYQKFASLYNLIRKASGNNHLLSLNETLTKMKSVESAISYMYNIVNQNHILNLELQYAQKMNQLLLLIEESGINKNHLPIINSYEREYTNIYLYFSEEQKNKKLKELTKKIEKLYQQYKKHILPMIEKINHTNKLLQEKIYIAKLYKNSNLSDMKEELLSYLTTEKNLEKSVKFNKLCRKIDEICQKISNLSTINIHPEYNSSYNSSNIIKYDLNGILLEINTETKECNIKFNDDKLLCTLMYYKKEIFIRNVTSKVLLHPLNEIVKPTKVNEQSLFKYLSNKEFPLDSALKSSINDLLKNLGIYKETYKEISPAELFKELLDVEKSMSLDQGKLNDRLVSIHILLEILHEDGYSLILNDKRIDNVNQFYKQLANKYQRLSISPATDKQVRKIISEVLLKRCQNEELIYSSIQNTYNCIDYRLKKKMYEELMNGIPTTLDTALSKVISIIQRYARKTDDTKYTKEEILEFIKSKNEIMNQVEYPKTTPSYYIENDLDRTIDILSEFDENSDLNEIHEILYKLTGIHR